MSPRFVFLRILISLLLLAGALSTSYPAAAGDGLPELFGSEVAGLAPSQVDALAARTHIVRFQSAGLESSRAALESGTVPGPLALSLFPDTRLVARFERVDHPLDGGFSLAGKIDGSWFGEIHASAAGGAFFASVNSPQGLFQITSTDGLTARITQLDPNRLPQEDEVVPVSLPGATAPAAPAVAASGPSATDDGARIDVYVGYTSAARSAAGSSAAIQAVINTAISETNTGYMNSGINQRVVLVGSGEYADAETGFNWNTTLSQWSNPADPVFGPAHTARDLLKADEMVLIVNDTAFCGLGYLMGSGSVSPSFAPDGFAEVSRTCAAGYYSFAHEMGHNMGAHHNREATSSPGAFAYSYGSWIWMPSSGRYDYRTIMAYNTNGYMDVNGNLLNYISTRVNDWSSPNVLYNGQPTGRAATDPRSADNAQTLNNTAWAVAQFRDGPAPTAPAGLALTGNGLTSVRLDWTNTAADRMKTRIERSPVVDNWVELGSVAPAATTFTDTTVPDGNAYRYRVLADNGNGRTASNIATIPAMPQAPASLVVKELSPSSVQLNWVDNDTLMDGFTIERAPSGGSFAPLTTTVPGVKTYTDSSVPPGGGYLYRVNAFNARGNSAYSNPAGAVPLPPSNPSGQAIQPSQVNLTWSDNSSIESGYKIDRSNDGGSNWTLLTAAALPVNASSYSDTTACGKNLYRIYAYNSAGPSDSAAASGLTYPCTPVLAGTPGTHVIYLNWQSSVGADQYRIYQWDTTTPGYRLLATLSGVQTGYPVTNLDIHTSYQFQIQVTNAANPTLPVFSNELKVKTFSHDLFLSRVSR